VLTSREENQLRENWRLKTRGGPGAGPFLPEIRPNPPTTLTCLHSAPAERNPHLLMR
jgi:hypothetical protein